MLFSLPNLITYGRIVLIPVIVVLMQQVGPHQDTAANYNYCMWATVFFAIAGISDLVDGYVARKYGEVSVLGKFIDPMADKLIHMAALVMLIPLNRVAAWIVVILLFREIFVNGIRAVAAGEGLIIDAAEWGKKKTAWLNCGIGGMIYFYPFGVGQWYELNVFFTAQVCLAVGMMYSLASAVVYTYRFYKEVKGRPQTSQ